MNSIQSLYFCKGFSNFEFSSSHKRQIYNMVNHDPNGRSFMIYDSQPLIGALNEWKEKLPWIDIHYPIKTMPDTFILTDMWKNGQGFDAASRGEIQILLNIGVNPQTIVYSNPIKDQLDLVFAEMHGIPLTVADTIQELHKIQKYAPNMKILWRISVDDPKAEKKHGAFGEKFGAPVGSEDDVRAQMKKIQEQGFNLAGVAFHTGSNHHGSSENLERALKLSRMVIRIGREYGHTMDTLDIGGGLPAGSLPEPIIDALKTTKDDPLGYKIFAEPGRHFATNCYSLAVRVVGIREKEDKLGYYLNDGIYHSFNNLLTDGVSLDEIGDAYYYQIKGDLMQSEFKKVNGILYGMTCCGQDILARNMPLPQDLNISDWLCFQGMGAYTLAIRSYFNSMESVVRIEKLVSAEEELEGKEHEVEIMPSHDKDSNIVITKQPQQANPQPQRHVPDISKNPAFGNLRYWVMKQITV